MAGKISAFFRVKKTGKRIAISSITMVYYET